MSSSYGSKIKIQIFGQSHSEAIGVVIDGYPAGIKLDREMLARFMERRAPGRNAQSTARQESDEVHFLSGVVDDVTCGAPICAVIYNHDAHSSDYNNLVDVPRPSHADYSAQCKFNGYQDVRGGGHFSGRLTAPLCIAGALCLQLLSTRGIKVSAHIYSVGAVKDTPFNPQSISDAVFSSLNNAEFPVLDSLAGERMKSTIASAKKSGDSVGGIIECGITGMPAGIGSPMFDGIENEIAKTVFAVPAVKGIEFGNGFHASELTGSENNDSFYVADDNSIRTRTNNHGGILGGISSGMPIIFRAAIKPTPSIGIEQDSISLSAHADTKLTISGRHDPCIVQRAVPCIEAAAALAVINLLI